MGVYLAQNNNSSVVLGQSLSTQRGGVKGFYRKSRGL